MEKKCVAWLFCQLQNLAATPNYRLRWMATCRLNKNEAKGKGTNSRHSIDTPYDAPTNAMAPLAIRLALQNRVHIGDMIRKRKA